MRKAADLTLKTLSKVKLLASSQVCLPFVCIASNRLFLCVQVCTRMCESTGSAAQRTVAVMLPTLLEKGIVSNVAEVRSLRYWLSLKDNQTSPSRGPFLSLMGKYV